MKYVDSPRRQLVMAVLLSLAGIGAAVRYWAPNPSLARDIGTLMLVLWLPAVGNLVAFAVRKLPRRAPRTAAFDDAVPFAPHLLTSMECLPEHAAPIASLPAGSAQCTLIVGNEGFTARAATPWTQVLRAGRQEVPLQLFRPSHALARLPAGTNFHCMVGSAIVAKGTVESAA